MGRVEYGNKAMSAEIHDGHDVKLPMDAPRPDVRRVLELMMRCLYTGDMHREAMDNGFRQAFLEALENASGETAAPDGLKTMTAMVVELMRTYLLD